MSLDGVSVINVELSSRCDKACSFCGHQNPAINTSLRLGDMDLDLVRSLASQIPTGVVVQFHRDGEPLVYPHLSEALWMFKNHTTSITTNGKKMVEKFRDLMFVDTICVSAFRGDPDGPEQFEIVKEFVRKNAHNERPRVLIKWVGDGDASHYEKLGLQVIRRLLHVPGGNTKYAHHPPTVPEIGICLDFLSHPSIDWEGNVYVCNRIDIDKKSTLGDANKDSLESIWESVKRNTWLNAHRRGKRDESAPICKGCTFWGVPSER